MIVECHECKSKVDANVIGASDHNHPERDPPHRISLVECPVCHSSLLCIQERFQTGRDTWELDDAARLWPEPDNHLSRSIPVEVRASLEEARKCYKASAFCSCAVMCGRAIEVICVQYSEEKTLYEGLKKLKEEGIIDGRLLEWSDSLRHERNLGAHASGSETTRDDARDLLDFATAICEYVYVLSKKYDEYQERKRKAAKKAS